LDVFFTQSRDMIYTDFMLWIVGIVAVLVIVILLVGYELAQFDNGPW
jgi:hypothetical protein